MPIRAVVRASRPSLSGRPLHLCPRRDEAALFNYAAVFVIRLPVVFAPEAGTLFVLKGETFAVRGAGERFNRLAQAEAGKLHVAGVQFAEP